MGTWYEGKLRRDDYPGFKSCGMVYDDWADKVTLKIATRHRAPWDETDLAILQDASEGRQGTPFDTAVLLGRTYSAVCEKARLMNWASPKGQCTSWAPFSWHKREEARA